MATELRRSFKEKARAVGIRLKRASEGATPPRPPSDNASSSQRPHSMDLTGAGVDEGLLNPLSWDNLPGALRERLEHPTKNEKEEMSQSRPGKENKRKPRNIVAQPKGTLDYTVETRDTMASIAAKFDTTTSELKKLNKLMTQMVFPGQVVYVPDKNYVPSSPSTPSPSGDITSAPVESSPPESAGSLSDVPNAKSDSNKSPFPDFSLGQFLWGAKDVAMLKMRMPGHAERQKMETDDGSSPVKPLSEEEARRLDEECFERFIKVSVKHITDGQGVVSGVLLVTPNAIMFDPNVSDPLVMEHGCEKYGMIAPMDTIISAAMYHDIAAMNLSRKHRDKTDEADSPTPKPEVYHNKNCPLYPGVKDATKDEDEKDSVDDAGTSETVASVSAPPPLGRKCSCSSFKTDARISSRASLNTSAEAAVSEKPETASEAAASKEKESSSKDSRVNTSLLTDVSVDGSDEVFATPQAFSSSRLHSKESTTTAEIPKPLETLTTAGRSISPSLQLQTTDLSSSPSSKARNESSSSLSHPSSGILSRTIGSISSMGSFAGTQLVDFSSGLFTRSQDDQGKVKDIGEGETSTQGKSVFYIGTDTADETGVDNTAVTRKQTDSLQCSDKTSTTTALNSLALEVENVVKLNDKPDLFRAFDELIPRPATLYEDPPLYLCLKVGNPLNKRVSKTCPIEAYLKNRQKPEYWFSIPLERVDQLYAFFIQWSPNIYGAESDVNAKERGFVIVDDSEEEGEGDATTDMVEDNFSSGGSHAKLARQMTKDWELVNLEEARRRISAAEIENLPLPELQYPSIIIDDTHIRQLCFHLPARAEGYPWTVIYSSEKHGFSLKTLYRTMVDIDSPILLVIRDTNHHVFGCLLSCALKMSDHFYGTGESFLFSFSPEFKKYNWTGKNNFFMKGNAESLSVGAGEGSFGLWLDGDLYHGRTQACQTFDNELLTGDTEDFVMSAVEAWGFL